MIEVQDLVKRYGSYLAVDYLSFRPRKGRFMGFLGQMARERVRP